MTDGLEKRINENNGVSPGNIVKYAKGYLETGRDIISKVVLYTVAPVIFFSSCGDDSSSPGPANKTPIATAENPGGGDSTTDTSTDPTQQEEVFDPQITETVNIIVDQDGNTPELSHFYNGNEPDLSKQNNNLQIKGGTLVTDVLFREGTDTPVIYLENSDGEGYVVKTVDIGNIPIGDTGLDAVVTNSKGDKIERLDGSRIKVIETDKYKCDQNPATEWVVRYNPADNSEFQTTCEGR